METGEPSEERGGGAGSDCGGVDPTDSPRHDDGGLPALVSFFRTKRRPRACFLLLSALQFVLGLAIFIVGVVAFSFTRSYMIGAFWAGPVLIVASVYNKVVCAVRVIFDDHPTIRKYKWRMAAATFILNLVSVFVNLTGTVLDIVAAYMLHRTDFSQCAYTPTELTASCESDICPHLKLPARTCYCCYLYEFRENGGCNTPLLLGKQTYFVSVNSCQSIANQLHPLLLSLAVMGLISVVLNAVFVFKTSPIVYPKNKASNELGSGPLPAANRRAKQGKHERAYDIMTANLAQYKSQLLTKLLDMLSRKERATPNPEQVPFIK